jgi:hypothetical protein
MHLLNVSIARERTHMELGQAVMGIAIVGGIGAYWWFKVGRHGGTQGYMRKKLGLQDGEEPAGLWMAYYDIDRTTGEKLAEVGGVRTRGINVMVALTTTGRLAIGDNEKDNPPIGFKRGEVSVREHAQNAEIGSLAGPKGMEQAVVMLLQPSAGESFRLQIARSGLEAVQAWSRGS